MIESTLLILSRDDLRSKSIDKNFKNIKLHDFGICLDCVHKYGVIIFKDHEGILVLSNKYGLTGHIDHF